MKFLVSSFKFLESLRSSSVKRLLKTQNSKLNSGFTLLLAALVASLVLTIGLAIVSIARKSVTLSSLGRDSQFAFYTADTASECALYWDLRHNAFATSSPLATILCDDASAPIAVTNNLPSSPTTFTFTFEPNGRCADVTVIKSDSHPRTQIRANGFSADCNSRNTNPRTLQRSAEIRY